MIFGKRSSDQTEDLLVESARDPYAFCRLLNFEPTFQQKELIDAAVKSLRKEASNRIAVKSGQGPGKSTVTGVLGLWLLLRSRNAKLLLTAPTMRQCKDVWLAEVKQTLSRANPVMSRIFNVRGTGIGVFGRKPDEWGCLTMTASRSENLQGQHRKNMHLIVEEASGVDAKIIEQFKGTMSNPNALHIQIGNPNLRACEFFRNFHEMRNKWQTYTWNSEETPASEWFDPQRNKDLEEEYGRNSDVYRVRVLGEFPHADPNCVFSSEDLEKVCGPGLLEGTRKISRDKQIGYDLARYGGDECVVFAREGGAIVDWWREARVDPSVAVRTGFKMQRSLGWSDEETVHVPDAGGIGQGVLHLFYEEGKRVDEFHSGAKSRESRKYKNRITEAWFGLRKKVQNREVFIPQDNILFQQLTTRQYFLDKSGLIVLESKDEYMKRGFESPDRADALVLSMCEPRGQATVYGGSGEVS